jgi:sugar porter (SP) family MFS transporter
MVWNPIAQTRHVFQDIAANPRYYWMAASACWGGMLFGWDSGLIGGILPRPAFKNAFGLSNNPTAWANISGWIVSVLQAGCFFGAMSAAWVSERFGRRGALFIAAFWFHLGSLLQTTAKSGSQSASSALIQLYVGRAVGGFGVGMVSVVVPTYVSESSPKHIRGRLTGMYQLFIVIGIALSFWVNYGMLVQIGDKDIHNERIWRVPFALQHIPGILLVLTMIPEKESPRWLGEKGRWEDAKMVIARLSQKSVDHPDVVNEVDDIRADLERNVKLSFIEQFRQATSSGKMFYRCSIPAIMMFWQQWTGVNSMNYYSPVIFQELGLSGGRATLLGTGIYGIVKIVMTVAVLSLGMEQYGRKALLVWGGVGQSLPMFYIAGYRHIRQGSPKIDGASYVAIVMIYLYVTFYSFGWSVAPWPAMSESVPNQLRSLTMSIGLMSNWLFNFTISKITPILLNKIRWGTYLLFACTTMSAVLWAVFFFPETGGYAIEDIHQLWEGNLLKQSMRDNKYLFTTYNNRAQGAVDADDVEHHRRGETGEKGRDSSSKESDDRIEKVREI